MFAGKTEELLRRVRRAGIAGRHVVVFTHALDTRQGDARVASHVRLGVPAIAVSAADAIEPAVPDDAEVVAIDEAQLSSCRSLGALPIAVSWSSWPGSTSRSTVARSNHCRR
jgi:thymidine kinase